MTCKLLVFLTALLSSVSLLLLQVRTLSTQLRDAQNLLISKDKAVAAAARRQGAHLSEDAEALLSKEQRRAAELTRELCRCERDIKQKHQHDAITPLL